MSRQTNSEWQVAAEKRDPFALAVHFDNAGMSREAYHTAYEAGAQAQALFAFESAAERFRIAKKKIVLLNDVIESVLDVNHV